MITEIIIIALTIAFIIFILSGIIVSKKGNNEDDL
jgi:hypothetical protein